MAESIQSVLLQAQASIPQSDSGRLDAELLLAHCLEVGREYLLAHPEFELSIGLEQKFRGLVERRAAGEPMAYILGTREFWDIELQVSDAVLIPRPETELLVEAALELGGARRQLSVLDLGTGSGAIALAIAKQQPNWSVSAVDISAAALAVARGNAHSLGLENVKFSEGSWAAGLAADSFDLVIANPPYITAGDTHLLQGDLRFEPELALVADAGGYGHLFTIIEQAAVILRNDSWLLLEHGLGQETKLAEKLFASGFIDVHSRQDLAGHCRMIQARWVNE